MTSTRIASALFASATLALGTGARAQHAHLDAALSDLVDRQAVRTTRSARLADPSDPGPLALARADAEGRLLVEAYLDGSLAMDDFVAQLKAAGAAVTGVNASYRRGAVSAFVPQAALATLAARPGLKLMKLSLKPLHHVGSATSQGVALMRSDVANASGFTGVGVTVGVLSDSYDRASPAFTSVRAADDIASHDLPVPKYVVDYPWAVGGLTDEGRAMMQVVHDVAPAADLCFATADLGEAALVASLRALRTDPGCNADVLVDDVVYYDEPIFTDGQLAQAVDEVSTSTTLPGRPVAYFSAAGNQGGADGGGSIDVPNARFSDTPTGLGAVQLPTAAGCASTPASGSSVADTRGGWLDFGGGRFALPLRLQAGVPGLMMAGWDDPTLQSGISTDLNFYLFDAATGQCVRAFANDNFATDTPSEQIARSSATPVDYLLMVARTGVGTHQASRLRIVNFGGFTGSVFTADSPVLFGHAASSMAVSVAAYRYSWPYFVSPWVPLFEPYSSTGPATIAFDATGQRLAVPETRKKPDLAAPDGVDTTFFYPASDVEPDGWNNFFGTSAAAPHAAGVAALLLQKAGGPGSLSPQQVKSILQTTAPARAMPYAGGPPTRGWSLYDGYGLIDAMAALARLP